MAKAKGLCKEERIFYNCKFEPTRLTNNVFLIIPSHLRIYMIYYVQLFRSYPEHYKGRIGRDMRTLGVSIAASIDKPWQWKLFFDEGGGVLPLLECIVDGARAVEAGKLDFVDGDVEGTNSLKEQNEASFAAACTACRALRDLSALSKDFAAVVTDDLLRVDTLWSTCVVEGDGYDCSSGGLISDLLILLKHANEAEIFYKAPKKGNPEELLQVFFHVWKILSAETLNLAWETMRMETKIMTQLLVLKQKVLIDFRKNLKKMLLLIAWQKQRV